MVPFQKMFFVGFFRPRIKGGKEMFRNKMVQKWNLWHTVTSQTQTTWLVAVVTYSGVSVVSGAAGVRAYLISLCRPARGPHKLHNGHKNSYYEPTYQHHEDSSDVLHTQTWNNNTRLKSWISIPTGLPNNPVRLNSLFHTTIIKFVLNPSQAKSTMLIPCFLSVEQHSGCTYRKAQTHRWRASTRKWHKTCYS